MKPKKPAKPRDPKGKKKEGKPHPSEKAPPGNVKIGPLDPPAEGGGGAMGSGETEQK